jgi:hypothetical protein
MTKLQGEDRPTYILSYPRGVRWGRMGLVALLAGAGLVRWILAWVRFVRPLIQAANASSQPPVELGRVLLDALAAQPLRPLIAAHLGLLLVAAALAFVYAFLPDLSLADDGLAARTLTGWQVIPWTAVGALRVATLAESQRRLVLVQGSWARRSLPYRLVSACVGAGLEPGLLLTSDIRDFAPLMRRVVQEIKRAAPQATFDTDFPAVPIRLVLEPVPTLKSVVEQARDEAWPLALSAQAMAAVAGGLVLAQLLFLILVGGAWWKPLALAGLCALEWLIGALYLYALTELFTTRYEFRQAALLYPLAQIPRALLAIPMAMLVAAGAPFLAAMMGLVGVVWAVILTALLVQQMYRLESILPAVLGGALQALFQFIVLAIVFSG